MSWVSSYVKSSVGAKHIMAITGIILAGFVLVHMLGNLLLLAGQDAINAYSAGLRETPALLWVARLVLLGSVVLHIASAYRLTVLNRAARPVKYARYRPIRTHFYARTMAMSGLILLAFIVYHLLHFTLGQVQPESFAFLEQSAGTYANVDALGRPDVYSMVVTGFQNPLVSASYIVAMVLLSMHLAHGVSSLFQSLGVNHPKYDTFVRYAGPVFAGVIFAGNTLIVLAVLAGIVKLPGA